MLEVTIVSYKNDYPQLILIIHIKIVEVHLTQLFDQISSQENQN